MDCTADPACAAPAPALSPRGLLAALFVLALVAAHRFRRDGYQH
jgi:MYXO-CTERM domain-containing protein